ncbi:MAG: hypothetical protein Q9167_007124 [Letrouitia subvulpina]
MVTIIVIIFLALLLFSLTKKRESPFLRALLSWLPFASRGRRTSSSGTPPRSLSPEKKVPSNNPPPAEYKDILPPSARENLAQAAKTSPHAQKDRLVGGTVDEAEVRKGLIPFTADYRACSPSTYTPSGFSVEEIKALGDFPDYAELSGVPLPEHYKEFKIETALPRPYRPFRWAYHQTMALTKMENEWWLELEKTYAARIAEREQLFEKYGKLVLNFLPGSELGCKEVMEMALQFLCARYPQYFRLSHTPEKGHVFHNGIVKTETVIKDMHPLHVLLHNVPEDFAVMLRNPEDGKYYFRAGILCSSLGWNVDTKLGLQLKDIHAPIPDYKEKMEFSMDRYFAKLPTSRPIQRGSWGLEIDTPLFMPPGDPHEKHRLHQYPDLSLDRIHLRVDWQTLRRLPLSAAIIFNFKAVFTPITHFRREPKIPALVAHILRHGKRSIMEYKNTWHVEHVALPALEKWAREQVDKGWVEEGWTVGTLEESPWWKGWEEVWREEQGF